MFTALLDTSVLWPSLQRDFLLSLAIEGLYRAVWSSAILEELIEHEARKLQRRGVPAEQAGGRATRLIEQMRASFGDAEVQGWQPLEGSFGLPDPDDEHVAAAAVIAGAGAIVTVNRRDFPADRLPDTLEVLDPAVFAVNTVSLDPARAARAVQAIAARSGRVGQTWTVADVLARLESRYAMGETVELLRQVLD